MRPSTVAYLTSQLQDIRRMAKAGMFLQAICAVLHCSHPTLRRFLKEQGIVLDRPTRLPEAKPPGQWNQFTCTDREPAPFTHADLKCRGKAEHSADELQVIQARLLMRMSTPRTIRRRLMVDQIVIYP